MVYPSSIREPTTAAPGGTIAAPTTAAALGFNEQRRVRGFKNLTFVAFREAQRDLDPSTHALCTQEIPQGTTR